MEKVLNKKNSKVIIIGASVETKFNCKMIQLMRKTEFSECVDFLMLMSSDKKGLNSYPFERVFLIELRKIFSLIFVLIPLIRKYDTVIFNGLFYDNKSLILFAIASIGKRTGWIIWGGDLYRNHGFLRRLILKFLRLSYLAVSIPKDLKKFNEVFGHFSGKVIKFWFPYSINNLPSNKLFCSDKKDFRIMIGNSASSNNRHMDAFDKLKKHKNQNFSIILPLSYGDKIYKKDVIDKAVQLFGNDRIEILDTFLKPELYAEVIKSVDLVFFNHNRQQGGQNLLLAAALSVPIVLSKENAMYDFLVTEGIDVNDVSSFSDVIKIPWPSKESSEAARKIVSDEYAKNIINDFLDKIVTN